MKLFLVQKKVDCSWQRLLLAAGLLWIAPATLLVQAQAQEDSAAAVWEAALVEAWRTEKDCLPETGMCDACGFWRGRDRLE
jgi:hypothetical protein